MRATLFLSCFFYIWTCWNANLINAQHWEFFSNTNQPIFEWHLKGLDANSLTPLPKNTSGPAPSYGIFWVFGDGNFTFISFESPNLPKNIRYNNVFWPQNNEPFVTAVYLTEQYSNDQPPDTSGLNVDPGGNVNQPTFVTPTNLSVLDPGRLVKMVANHAPRSDHESLFALSYLPIDHAGTVWLFYNSLIDSTDLSGNGLVPAIEVLKYKRSHFPYYYTTINNKTKPSGRTKNPTAQQFSNVFGLGTNFQDDFANATGFKFLLDEQLDDNLGTNYERRLFHAYHADPQAGVGLEDRLMDFLVLLTTRSPDESPDVDGHPMRNRIYELFDDGTNIVSFNQNNSNKKIARMRIDGQWEYLLDIKEDTLEYAAAHDPNRLCFEEYCDCTKDTTKCRSSMSLEICNTGNLGANNAKVRFVDFFSKGFECLHIFKIEELFNNNAICSFPAVTLDKLYDKEFELPCRIPGIGGKYKGPQCVKVYFTVEAPKGVCVEMIEEDSMIRADVTFVDGGPIDEAYSMRCGDLPDAIACKSGYRCDCVKKPTLGDRLAGYLDRRPLTATLIVGVAGIFLFVAGRRLFRINNN